MPGIFPAISCNLDENIISAALPLFQSEKISAIEWSFDTLYKFRNIPPWFTDLLETYGNQNRLIGHGVYFSLFSGRWSMEQQDWLNHLQKISTRFTFDHISEHFGFMTGENFHQGAPMSIPFTTATLHIGRDRLKRIYHACHCPVGLENLAFSYSFEEVKKHGEFLDQLVEPVNGFIILDLHNVYCQSYNFNIPPEDIICQYPLHRVREIHISGGSWEDSLATPGKRIRRDTHDERVPQEVFYLLNRCIDKCPYLKYVVLEQLGNGLNTASEKAGFRKDFYEMSDIVINSNIRNRNLQNTFEPENFALPEVIAEDDTLHAEQSALSDILETATSPAHARTMLESSILYNTLWQPEKWEPYMLETAIAIAQKWKNGFA